MFAYISRRFLIGILSLVGVSIIAFTLTRIIPSSPADMWMGPRATSEQIERTRIELGLDQSLFVQYKRYITAFLKADLGTSIVTKQPVLLDIATYLPASLELIVFGILLGFSLGIPLGILSAARAGSGIDHISRLFSITGVALPSFWLAMILQLIFGKLFSLLPLTGRIDVMTEIMHPITHITGFYSLDSLFTGNWIAFRDMLLHIILPGVTLAAYPLGLATRLVRTTMLEVLGEDYIRTARASGVSEFVVLTVFALRNALGPILTIGVLLFGYSLVSTFLIESLFAWPGIGRYTAKAIVSVDYPAIMGITLLVAATYVILNLIADIAQTFLDPRIRLS